MTTTALVPIESIVPEKTFVENGSNDVVEDIKRWARSQELDASTEAGRKKIASVAYDVARSKTTLLKMGKDLKDQYNLKIKPIQAECNRIEKELDDLKAEIRKPLTDYETREETRINDHEQALACITNLPLFLAGGQRPTADRIKELLDQLPRLYQRDWQEFSARALHAHEETFKNLKRQHDEAVQYEKDQAELARLREEKEARERQEREDQIRKDAEDRTRREAEEKAQRDRDELERVHREEQNRLIREQEERDRAARSEQERLERERQESVERARLAEQRRQQDAEQAEIRRVAAEKQAEEEKVRAVQAERNRQEREEAERLAAERKRQEDHEHRRVVNNEACEALWEKVIKEYADTSKETCQKIIIAIAKGEIPHVKISY